MSEPIEKRSGTSVVLSAAGSWAGLSFGLGLLITAVLAVTGVLTKIAPPERAMLKLEQRLSADMVALVAGSLKVPQDGSRLEMTVYSSTAKKKVKVIYSRSQDGDLFRSEGGAKELLGNCREANFLVKDSLLVSSLSDDYGRDIHSWAIDRWRAPK